MSKIIYNISSYDRKETLIKTIESIYNQSDIINVSLNNYSEIPLELYDKKINIFITNNEKGDAYKFYRLNNSNGYFFTIDDDLIYPKNYTEYMISKVEYYNRKNIITIHGRNFKSFPINSYYSKNAEVLHFRQTLKIDKSVQFGGTGVMAFHTDLFKVGIDYFEYPNMADVWIGKFAKENGLRIMCVEHDSNFIKQQEFVKSIYSNDLKKDTLQTKLVNTAYIKDLSIIIPTFKNTEYIDECIYSIVKSSNGYNIEILVGIDACDETLKYIKNKNYPKNVKFYYFSKNEGPYLIKNSLSTIAESNNILFFDSDDIMKDSMIKTIIENINGYKMIKIKYKNFSEKKLEQIKEVAFGEGVFVIKKEIFQSMNGFEPWFCSADSDFMKRFYNKYDEKLIMYTKEIMFDRRVHDKGLTVKKETGMMSSLREEYSKISKEKGYLNPNILNIREFIKIKNR